MSMLRRLLVAATMALMLLAVPSLLAAQEREVQSASQASVLSWFSGFWNDVTVWLVTAVGSPKLTTDSFREGSCAVDPDGCPGGA